MPVQELVGNLMKDELQAAVPTGIFHRTFRNVPWTKIIELVRVQSDEVLALINNAIKVKEERKQKKQVKKKKQRYEAHQQEQENNAGEGSIAVENCQVVEPSFRDHSKFMELPTDEMMAFEGKKIFILSVPNIKQRLRPAIVHPSYDLWEGMLLAKHSIEGDGASAVAWALTNNSMPKHALVNNLWIGDVPHELAILTLPEQLLALMWLKCHSEIYKDIAISDEHLYGLPEDDVPMEILSIIQHKTDVGLVQKESAGYVPCDDSEMNNTIEVEKDENVMEVEHDANVIPLQFLGVTDTEMNSLSLNELMKYALTNMEDKSELKEGGYAVRHSLMPVSDFSSGQHGECNPNLNPLAAAYPVLFPYDIGGIEASREKKIGFNEHIQWALQYYDR
ncbi:uncharacterized protein EDB93DRAFT_1110038 [Suillus bovinus]|uniref:uncharacterized protein n=1 Tax=Suillus bovinus TaxID=48563 RepID=UPI001B882728|nr:uncharacterized protein EDB93DRAFT_1110038 [Suillus bovinus]KAG2125704.1 hypothetical protein EDB93DRAFT_1110038 [Suillus bovinus]